MLTFTFVFSKSLPKYNIPVNADSISSVIKIIHQEQARKADRFCEYDSHYKPHCLLEKM